MYINSGYLHNSLLDFKDKSKPLVVGSCGTYRLIHQPKLPTYRPVGGVTYHFSYALDDQQNFSDTANVCIMKQAGMPGLPDSVMWNAYTVPDNELERLTFDASGFLALYAGGAMKHKNGTMQRGGERKAAVEAATTAEEVEAA